MMFTVRIDYFLLVIIHKWLCCNLAILYKFALHLTKYIVIFTIWIDNWRMILANLGKAVRKEKGRTNRLM